MAYRTDLAVELLENLRGRDELSGVSEREYEREGLHIHEAEVTTERAARLLGKPCGRYLTLSLEALSRREEEAFPRSVRVLAALIETLLPPLDSAAPVLIAGLGSRSITPDAVGPRSADHVIATRHLISRSPEFFASWRPVSVLAPGVLGQTGVETGEIVRGVLDHVRPRAVIAIDALVDALASRSLRRVCRTIQLADTGIVPGSGVNNARTALDRQTLGVPVVSIGVPTVADGGSLAHEIAQQLDGAQCEALDDLSQPFIITTRDIDREVADTARLIGYAVNMALQHISVEEIDLYLS